MKQKEPAGNKGQEQSNEVTNYFMLSILAANDAALHNFNFTLVLDHAGGGDQLNCMCKYIYTVLLNSSFSIVSQDHPQSLQCFQFLLISAERNKITDTKPPCFLSLTY